MIVRHINESLKDRKIEDSNGNWNSVRMLLKDDGMGFSFISPPFMRIAP